MQHLNYVVAHVPDFEILIVGLTLAHWYALKQSNEIILKKTWKLNSEVSKTYVMQCTSYCKRGKIHWAKLSHFLRFSRAP